MVDATGNIGGHLASDSTAEPALHHVTLKQDSASLSDAATPARRRHWMPITVISLGVASIAMLFTTNWIREQLMIQDVALVHAVLELQTREALAHLWYEEYFTGDEVHLAEAQKNQERSAYLVNAILEGGNVAEGRYELKPVTEPGIRDSAITIRNQVDQFRGIAETRQRGYELGQEVGIGSKIDT